MRGTRLVVALLAAVAEAGAVAAQETGAHDHAMPMAADSSVGGRTPLYDNLGRYHMAITTRSSVAQQYFDQGLRLTYAFNHDEAINSYREGTRQDSTCAMCWWGIAYALGPNINVPMDTAAVQPAWNALQHAVKLAPAATRREQAYIKALATRYVPVTAADRTGLDSAWAGAIGEVARRYPADDDAATLHAEALMDLRPWHYWTNAGKPLAPSTLQTVTILEGVLKRNPDHPGACHFYIHAIEASNFAGRAVPCAERLGSLMPGAGHLVHMPTHIYMRLGRWEDAVEHNAMAVHADQEYLDARHPTGVYPLGYVPHNYHVMWEALNMTGRSTEALAAARTIQSKVPIEVVRMIPPFEYYSPVALFTLVRFSRWNDALAEPAPEPDLRYTTGIWYYARGLAHAAKGHFDSAAVALDSVGAIAAKIPPEQTANLNSSRALLQVAEHHLAADIAARRGRVDEAVRGFRAGIAIEDDLVYDEPTAWAIPLRQPLGAVLLAAGRPRDAERAYRQDLVRYPNNGWSLHGLAEALKAQGRTREAAAVEKQFRKVWEKSDVKVAEVGKR
ncbi:MAG: tetratricopeptide repeat protein [Gemmatimonadales bacterium]